MSNNIPRIPRKLSEFAAFLSAHGPKWKTAGLAIGLSTSQGTAIDAAATAMNADYQARLQAEQDAKAAVATLADTWEASRELAADLLRIIDAFAINSPNPTAVWNLAEVAAPSPPKPIPAPGLPEAFTVTLDQTGDLNLAWKCNNPPGGAGVIYEVMRRLGPTGPFTYLGATGTRKFVDNSLPGGNSTVGYQITGIRSTLRGPAAQFVVNFGMAGGGMSITSVTEQVSAKLAA